MPFIAYTLPVLLGLLNRCRGGWIQLKSGQLGRVLFWALPIGFIVLLGWGVVPAVYALLLAFLGVAIPAWGLYVGLKTEQDWLLLSACGLCVSGFPAIGIAIESFNAASIYAVSGLLMPVFYWLGQKIPSKVKNFEQGTPLGELFFGAWLGFVLALLLIFKL